MALAADLDFMPMEPVAPVWQPWIEFGGKASSDLSGVQVRGFAPWALGHNSLFFVQLDGKVLEKDVLEGNVALGYRHMMADGWNLGLWGGFDVHRSRSGKTYDQVSGGFELLHPNWDFRVNGYLPLDRRNSLGGSDSNGVIESSSGEVVLTDDQIFMLSEIITRISTREERALKGFDGEIGWRFPVEGGGLDPNRHEVRVYGGGFHFERVAGRSVTGPMGRLEWRINDALPQLPGSRVTFEAGISHDRVRDTVGFAGLNLRIPFGRPPASLAAMDPQSRRMIDPLVRQHQVLTRRVGTETTTVEQVEEQVADALTNVRFDRVARVEDGDSVTDTSAQAGANSLIIAEGGTISGPQQLQGDQTLQGGGSTIDVVGVETGTVAPFTAPGTRPSLANPGNAANLTLLGSNTHVAGLAIEGAGQFSGFGSNNGIEVGSDRQNVFIGLSEISNTGREGINIGDRNEVTIYSTEFRNIGDDAIDVNGDDNMVTITDVATLNTTSEGLDLNGTGNTVTVANMSITNAGDHGIEVGSGNTFTIDDSTISNTDEHGIEIGSGNTVTINTTTIEGYGDDGIRIDGSANTVDIANSTIRDGSAGDDGVGVDGSNNIVNLDNVSIVDPGDDGFDINGSFNIVNIIDSTIARADDGMAIDGDDNEMQIVRTSIIDSRDDGIDFDGSGNLLEAEELNISGTVQEGIDAGDDNELTLANSSISDTGDSGLLLRSGSTVRLLGSTIANTGDDAIMIEGDFNTLELTDSEILDAGDNAINIDGDDNTVVVGNTLFDDIANDGIDTLGGVDNTVTVTDTTFLNVSDHPITMGSSNTYVITNTTIDGAGRSGIRMDGDNTVTLEDSVLTGHFDEDGIHLNGGNNTLDGAGNTAAGATFGGQFCETGGFLQNGFFSFLDDGTGTPGTCP